MEGKYKDNTIHHARIYIDYEKKRVKIGYPNKESYKNRKSHKISAILQLTFLILFITLILYILMLSLTKILKFPLNDISIFVHLSLIILNPLILVISLLIINKEDFYSREIFIKIIKYFHELSEGIKERKVTNLKSKIFTIPLFSNIYLEYTATKDYGKYLKNIEIKEHDYKKVIKRRKYLIFGKQKIVSKKNQIEHWYVNFEFSKIPKKGNLIVRWI